ncbi:questin oxidase family protein [Vibrio cholerae]|uniref:questin oxidase family protein n=2 Tax=Vibrio cholerae TaxID=666 RepID=UPI000E0B862C|nr:questin oxidase family protein [Vibrio cholerae]EJL6706345.1 questin oxidase family protein [Vibrio cholerae]EJL6821255.1 questin oxidase family protein [Vibrio cholerae]MCX9546669.1 questin oxidase family protein [Vibrio cholerae]HAS3564023.1 questin oxidase family protein [Vibrio cholerae]
MSVNQLLNDKTYDIEFNGHLTNHIKHAVIALEGLGIPSSRIQEYYENYATMTPYGMGLEAPRDIKHEINQSSWKDFLGKRTSFWSYCHFFEQEIEQKGIDMVIQEYVPVLMNGWAGALTHGTIHLGWALHVNNRWMIVEGLAYLAFSYIPCYADRATIDSQLNDQDAVDSLLRLANLWHSDERENLTLWLDQLMNSDDPDLIGRIHPELLRSGLQNRIARVLMQGHPEIYRLPQWIDTNPPKKSWEQLRYLVTLIYLSKPGDFLLLHLVTSLFAMEKIALHLPDRETKNIIRHYWIGVQCILFATDNFSKPHKLLALNETYQARFDENCGQKLELEWEHIISRALEEEEEHNPKLVYVMNQYWINGHKTIFRAAANQFTSTPELPESFETPPIDEWKDYHG